MKALSQNLEKKTPLVVGVIVLALVLLGYSVVSNSRPTYGDNRLTAAQQTIVNKIDEIIKATGGDPSKLSADDRAYLLKELSGGDEATFNMDFDDRAIAVFGTRDFPAFKK